MAGEGIDPKILGRVRALLAKAESTEFPEEAEALSAKAHQLMARYAIDQLPHDTSGGPGLHRVAIDSPYPSAKFLLLGGIAQANRCEAIWSKHDGVATLVGFPVDVTTVELLYTSLLIQATTAMLAHGPKADHRGRSRTKAFRHSFLLAFGSRIGHRLAQQTAAEEEAAAAEPGTDLVPLLAERAAEVDRAVDEAFPRLRTHRVSASSGDGVRAGQQAADRADLGDRRLAS
jgi:Protein of unknown function (DUF2786)